MPASGAAASATPARCSPPRCRSPAASAATATRSSPGRCSAATPGGNGGTLIQKAGSDDWLTVKELYGKVSSSKFANVRFEPGDRIKLTTPGGGGYGIPGERDREAVREDVREGYVSEAAARELYGLD